MRNVKGEGRGGEGRGGKEEGRGGKEEGRGGKEWKKWERKRKWIRTTSGPVVYRKVNLYTYIMYLRTYIHACKHYTAVHRRLLRITNYTDDSHQTLTAHLHTAITHMISVLERRWRLMRDYAIEIHARLRRSNTFIMCVIAVCNV